MGVFKNLTRNDKSLLREISEFEYQNAIEVFETEPYDDLGHQALEIVGAAAVVIDRLGVAGPLELSDEIVQLFVQQWIHSALDAERVDCERYKDLQDLQREFA